MIDTTGMGGRIKQIIAEKGITQLEFAQRLNISQSMVSKICSGATVPSVRTQIDICEKFGVDTNWFETGEGEMFYKESDYDRLMDYFSEFQRGFHDPIYTKFLLAILKCSPKELYAIQKLSYFLNEQKETPPEDPEA